MTSRREGGSGLKTCVGGTHGSVFNLKLRAVCFLNVCIVGCAEQRRVRANEGRVGPLPSSGAWCAGTVLCLAWAPASGGRSPEAERLGPWNWGRLCSYPQFSVFPALLPASYRPVETKAGASLQGAPLRPGPSDSMAGEAWSSAARRRSKRAQTGAFLRFADVDRLAWPKGNGE